MKKSFNFLNKVGKSIVVLFIITLFLLLMGVLANSNSETYTANNLAPGITSGIITIIIFIKSVISKKRFAKKEYQKPTLQHIIYGIILCILGGLLTLFLMVPVLLLLEEGSFSTIGLEGTMVSILMGICGIIALLSGIRCLQGKYVKATSEHKNSYLTDDANDDNLSSYNVFSIDGMEGHKFEYFCADILRRNGFIEVEVTKGSGDQGVDIVAVKDGIKYAIQCKNYSSPLSNKSIQEVNAGKIFYNCHVGVVLTNSTFTPGAKALAEATGVLLWDREKLQEMMKSEKN